MHEYSRMSASSAADHATPRVAERRDFCERTGRATHYVLYGVMVGSESVAKAYLGDEFGGALSRMRFGCFILVRDSKPLPLCFDLGPAAHEESESVSRPSDWYDQHLRRNVQAAPARRTVAQ